MLLEAARVLLQDSARCLGVQGHEPSQAVGLVQLLEAPPAQPRQLGGQEVKCRFKVCWRQQRCVAASNLQQCTGQGIGAAGLSRRQPPVSVGGVQAAG